MKKIRVVVAQLGAREDYLIPLVFQQAKLLRAFFTDIYANPIFERIVRTSGSLHFLPAALKRLLTRHHPELDMRKVHHFPASTLYQRFRKHSQQISQCQNWLDTGRLFASRVARKLPMDTDVVIGFHSASEEILEEAKRRGIYGILDQTSPGIVHYQMVEKEQRKYTDWSGNQEVRSSDYISRVSREWQLADRIVVNSEYSRRCLIQAGVISDKIWVIPLGYNAPTLNQHRQRSPTLRVLFLGNMSLTKGIHYYFQAARMTRKLGRSIRFSAAGGIEIFPNKMAEYADIIEYLGVLPRNKVPLLLQDTDVLIQPSVSEGFGRVQLEAMAQGIPVIASTNMGEVVRHGIDGFRIETGDVAAIIDALCLLASNRLLLENMSAAAIQRAKEFSVAKFRGNWVHCVMDLYINSKKKSFK